MGRPECSTSISTYRAKRPDNEEELTQESDTYLGGKLRHWWWV